MQYINKFIKNYEIILTGAHRRFMIRSRPNNIHSKTVFLSIFRIISAQPITHRKAVKTNDNHRTPLILIDGAIQLRLKKDKNIMIEVVFKNIVIRNFQKDATLENARNRTFF